MKALLNILLITMTTQSFAGGSGGGGVLSRIGQGERISVGNGTGIITKEYVKFLDYDRGEINFEYGQVNQREEIYTEKYKLRSEEIGSEKTIITLKLSANKNDWVELRK